MLNICNEYERTTDEQTKQLAKYSGPLKLKKFGPFRKFLQNFIDKTRDKVRTSRRDAMISAFNAATKRYYDNFARPVPATIIFNTRQYKVSLKSCFK